MGSPAATGRAARRAPPTETSRRRVSSDDTAQGNRETPRFRPGRLSSLARIQIPVGDTVGHIPKSRVVSQVGHTGYGGGERGSIPVDDVTRIDSTQTINVKPNCGVCNPGPRIGWLFCATIPDDLGCSWLSHGSDSTHPWEGSRDHLAFVLGVSPSGENRGVVTKCLTPFGDGLLEREQELISLTASISTQRQIEQCHVLADIPMTVDQTGDGIQHLELVCR